MERRVVRRWRLSLGIALLAGLWATEEARACWTPLEWQQKKPLEWDRDEDRNSIEDSLDTIIKATPGDLVHVVLDLAHCADPQAMSDLAKYGQVLKRGRFVTFVAMEVKAIQILDLAKLPIVAKVEEMHGFSANLDVSGAAIKVRSGFYSPQTLEDVLPNIRGQGRTLAVVDSGVDDQNGAGITHQMFPPGKFVGGYSQITQQVGNPNDSFGHGTHVAGIAIGAQSGSRRGMAPDAGLVDCQTTFACGPASWLDVIECFEQILLNDATWGVDAVNISLKQCDTQGNTITTNGTDAASMLANQLVAHGISVVAAAANDGPNNVGLTSPCAADNAICVAAMDDFGTQSRVGDQIAGFSSRGPRTSDSDSDVLDERKPDVSAPGVNISSAQANTTNSFVNDNGTSMASPHVAGVVLLIAQTRPGINPGSIKHLLISTAEDRGPAGWDAANGHGYVDVFQAVAAAASGDPGYPGAGTYAEPWLCTDISTASPAQVNVPNTLIANVINLTGTPLTNVQVTFGVYIYSAGIPDFYSIGTQTISLPAWGQTTLTQPWTPQPSSSGDPHACLKTTINYGLDTNFSNNVCNRNININQTNSPVSFRFQVQSNLTQPAMIRLVPEPLTRFPRELEGEANFRMLPGERMYVPSRWTHKITAEELKMEPGDCPVDITLTLDLAEDARPVDGAVYSVPGLAVLDNGQQIVMDGVTAYGHSPCPAEWGGDSDGDAVCDVFDTCATIMNPEQLDADGDGIGDMCDARPYASDTTGYDEACKSRVAAGELRAQEAYTCLQRIKTGPPTTRGKLLGATSTAGILNGKIGAAQVSLCRQEERQAGARLEALQHQMALLEQVEALSFEERRTYSTQVSDCQRLLPASASAAAPAGPAAVAAPASK